MGLAAVEYGHPYAWNEQTVGRRMVEESENKVEAKVFAFGFQPEVSVLGILSRKFPNRFLENHG